MGFVVIVTRARKWRSRSLDFCAFLSFAGLADKELILSLKRGRFYAKCIAIDLWWFFKENFLRWTSSDRNFDHGYSTSGM